MKQICEHCYEWIEGGAYTEVKGKRIFFCSGKCIDEYK